MKILRVYSIHFGANLHHSEVGLRGTLFSALPRFFFLAFLMSTSTGWSAGELKPSVVEGKDERGFSASLQPAAKFPNPSKVEISDELGRGVQRTLKSLTDSQPENKRTVRILFYGQSITEQSWSKTVGDSLRQRFPNANLVIENRAIGGFSSNLLVQTSEADLYPFYPDLMIFYVYGRHDNYEDIIRSTRQRTTSQILLQTDHLNGDAKIEEETDPAKLSMGQWNSWFPNVFIPGIAEKYQTGMVQQRSLWKLYARENHLEPRSLTADGVHLNDRGNFLMASLVDAYLVRRPTDDEPAVEQQIRDYPIGPSLAWKDDSLTLPFTGNKIDIIAQPGATGSARVLIDGRKPSEYPELYTATRSSSFPGTGWPVFSKVLHESPAVLETWTAVVTEISPDFKQFKFSVEGTVTGKDGSGESGKRFVSNSGRVVIEPEAWNIAYSCELLRNGTRNSGTPFTPPDRVTATWQVIPLFVDEYHAPEISDPTSETLVTLAQGLPNGPHELKLLSTEPPAIKALRVYQPPLKAEVP